MRFVAPFALTFLCSAACVSSHATLDQLRLRAANDFECKVDDTDVTRQLDTSTFVVEGCGKKDTYVETCHAKDETAVSLSKQECTWLRNGK